MRLTEFRPVIGKFSALLRQVHGDGKQPRVGIVYLVRDPVSRGGGKAVGSRVDADAAWSDRSEALLLRDLAYVHAVRLVKGRRSVEEVDVVRVTGQEDVGIGHVLRVQRHCGVDVITAMIERHVATLPGALAHHANLGAGRGIGLIGLELIVGKILAIERNSVTALRTAVSAPRFGRSIA